MAAGKGKGGTGESGIKIIAENRKARAAYTVQINTAMLAARFEGLVAHAAFADDAANAEVANDLPLVRLLTNRGGRSSGGDLPFAIRIFHHDGTAVVDNSVP